MTTSTLIPIKSYFGEIISIIEKEIMYWNSCIIPFNRNTSRINANVINQLKNIKSEFATFINLNNGRSALRFLVNTEEYVESLCDSLRNNSMFSGSQLQNLLSLLIIKRDQIRSHSVILE